MKEKGELIREYCYSGVDA